MNNRSDIERYTRVHPCPICGGDTHSHPHCHGFLSEGSDFAYCTREEYAGGAELNEKCEPPAYVFKHEEDGSYRPWLAHLPLAPITRLHPKPATAVRKARNEGKRTNSGAPHLFMYGPLQAVKRQDFVREMEDGTTTQDKDISQLHRTELEGEWIPGNGPGDIERVYGRDRLDTDNTTPVVLVEGEKCADRLDAENFLSVTWRGGTGGVNKALPQLLDVLAGREVVLMPDADTTGRKAMDTIAAAIARTATTVRMVTLYEDDSKRDVVDFLENNTVETFNELLNAAPAYTPTPQATERVLRDRIADREADTEGDTDTPKGYAEWIGGRSDLWEVMQHGVPPVCWLAKDLVPATGITAIYGQEGSGKTWLALHAILCAVRQGSRVVHIDEEAGKLRTAKRLIAMGFTREDVALIDHIPYATGGNLKDFAAIVHYHIAREDVALVVIDSVSKVLAAFDLKENDPGENTTLAAALFTPIASMLDKAVLLLDHVPHGQERPRGASSKGADYDLAWYAETVCEGSPAERGETQLTRKKDRNGTEAPGYLCFAYGGNVPAQDYVQYLGPGKSDKADAPRVTPVQEARDEAIAQAIIALYGKSNAGMTYGTWKRTIQERTGRAVKTCERYITSLTEKEDVEGRDGLYFVTKQGYAKYTPFLVENRPKDEHQAGFSLLSLPSLPS